LAAGLSHDFSDLHRGVEIATAASDDFEGDTDESYGDRAFLRHYCAHLAVPDHAASLPTTPADARAARGFTEISTGTCTAGESNSNLTRLHRKPSVSDSRVGRSYLSPGC
jgi:hypothetical protein